MPDENPDLTLPKINAASIHLLERLCNASSVSGDEAEVRKIVLEQIQPAADSVKIDALGNILAERRSSNGSTHKPLRVMVAAHMDEVGFMITSDEGDGFYRFQTVGGVDARQIAGKPVQIGSEHIPGVIGAKPIHLTTASERKNAISIDSLRIDVGPSGKKIQPGSRAVFATKFTRLGPSVRGKALDDRIGVASLIHLIKHPPANVDLLAAFTVQEEVGLRGARVAAYACDPDAAIVMDCTPAYDLPVWDEAENTQYNARLGDGGALYIADSATLSDPRLLRHFIDTAEAHRLPYQFRQAGGGGTDAGAIHKARAGVPSLSISVPGRYLHTAAAIARVNDWQHTLQLVYAALNRLTPAVFQQDR
ncbi:MAG: M42 family metallopeptidase [Anaerolineales bacterium]|jgi:putative aminopeptidase FrvX